MKDPERAEDTPNPTSEHLEPTGHTNPLLVHPPQKPNIGAVPSSAMLKRLHDFLPQLAAANASLPTNTAPHDDPYLPSLQPRDKDPEPALCVLPTEHAAVDDDSDDASDESDSESQDSGVHVEMDLACGVFELHDASASEAAARAAGTAGSLSGAAREEAQQEEGGGALHTPEELLRAMQGRSAADLREVTQKDNSAVVE